MNLARFKIVVLRSCKDFEGKKVDVGINWFCVHVKLEAFGMIDEEFCLT